MAEAASALTGEKRKRCGRPCRVDSERKKILEKLRDLRFNVACVKRGFSTLPKLDYDDDDDDDDDYDDNRALLNDESVQVLRCVSC